MLPFPLFLFSNRNLFILCFLFLSLSKERRKITNDRRLLQHSHRKSLLCAQARTHLSRLLLGMWHAHRCFSANECWDGPWTYSLWYQLSTHECVCCGVTFWGRMTEKFGVSWLVFVCLTWPGNLSWGTAFIKLVCGGSFLVNDWYGKA